MGLLSEGERLGATFVKLRAHAEARLTSARSLLEDPQCPHEKAQMLRGRILELKQFIQLGESDPIVNEYVE